MCHLITADTPVAPCTESMSARQSDAALKEYTLFEELAYTAHTLYYKNLCFAMQALKLK